MIVFYIPASLSLTSSVHRYCPRHDHPHNHNHHHYNHRHYHHQQQHHLGWVVQSRVKVITQG